MSELERRRDDTERFAGAWYGWASPVGLGLFFVLGAVAFDLVHLAIK